MDRPGRPETINHDKKHTAMESKETEKYYMFKDRFETSLKLEILIISF